MTSQLVTFRSFFFYKFFSSSDPKSDFFCKSTYKKILALSAKIWHLFTLWRTFDFQSIQYYNSIINVDSMIRWNGVWSAGYTVFRTEYKPVKKLLC